MSEITKSSTNGTLPLGEHSVTLEDGAYDRENHPHNYYDAEKFITRETATGQINLLDGQRAVYASEDFIVGLNVGVEHEVGDASNTLMYKCGFEWGANEMKRCADRMRHQYGGGKKDIWSMNKKFVMETWWWPLTTEGWGGWSIDFGFSKQGMTFATIHNSVVAKAMEQVGKPVCHMYAGMFAGALSFVEKQPREAIEVQCYSMGNNCCKFLVGTKDKVNAAEFWRREGANANEILNKIAV